MSFRRRGSSASRSIASLAASFSSSGGRARARPLCAPSWHGDLLTGSLALPVAIYVARRGSRWRLVGYGWNLFGLVDFAVALSIATFAVSSGFRYPVIMILTFAVPLGIILHALSLWQLSRIRPSRAERSSTHLGCDGVAQELSPKGVISKWRWQSAK